MSKFHITFSTVLILFQLLVPSRVTAQEIEIVTSLPPFGIAKESITRFAKLMLKSGIKVRIKRVNRSLGSDQSDLVKMASAGKISSAQIRLATMAKLDPFFEFDSLPIIAHDLNEVKRIHISSFLIMKRRAQRLGLTPLFVTPLGSQGIFTNARLKSIGHLKGKKVAVGGGLNVAWLEAFGAATSNLTIDKMNRVKSGIKGPSIAQVYQGVVSSLPIRLTHSPATCRVLPFPRIEFIEGRCADIASGVMPESGV